MHAGTLTRQPIATLVLSTSEVVPTLLDMTDTLLRHPLGMTGSMIGMRRGALGMQAEALHQSGPQLIAMHGLVEALIGSTAAALDMVVPPGQVRMTERLVEAHEMTEVHQHQHPHLSASWGRLNAAEA